MADFDIGDDDGKSGVRIGLPMDGLNSRGLNDPEHSHRNRTVLQPPKFGFFHSKCPNVSHCNVIRRFVNHPHLPPRRNFHGPF
jgi:hypothetical protein